jgi:hypothetical protein
LVQAALEEQTLIQYLLRTELILLSVVLRLLVAVMGDMVEQTLVMVVQVAVLAL